MKNHILRKGQIINFNLIMEKGEESHSHQDIELIFVLDGSVEIKIQEETFQLEKDDIILVNSNKKHSYRVFKDSLVGMFIVNFQEISSYLETNFAMFWCNSIIDKGDSYEFLRSYIKKILNHYLLTEGKEDYYQLSLFYGMVNCLINYFLINHLDENFRENNKEEIRINEIISYINNNYNQEISLSDLASKLFLSNAYLSRYFKKNFGITFMEYLNNVRLHHAVEDLIYLNKPITKVALDNGFASSALFNKTFKETYKLSPTTYQKNIREELEKKNERSLDHNGRMMNKLSTYFENNSKILKEEKRSDLYIDVDSKNRKCYKKNWSKMINIGAASELLNSVMQEHVIQLRKKLKFRYVRFWGIFANSMYIGLKEHEGDFNFDKVDRVLDFLINNEIKPYIELAQKPRIIHRRIGEPVVEEEIGPTFKSLEFCENIMEHFISHLIERYGLEEVESWYFELWSHNEAKTDIEYIEELYFKIFNTIVRTIKKYAPNAKVGGSGLAIDYGKKKISELVDIWASQSVKPDFISLHLFPYVLGEESSKSYAKISADRDYLVNKIGEAKEIFKAANMDNIELHISEWNSTISNRNYSNDSCYKGAYIMKNVIDCSEEVDILGYWIGSDLFSEFYDTSNLLWGGAGLISKDGIEKPAFHAFDFMNRMGDQFLQKGSNYMITSNSNNSFYIACHNYKHFNYYYYIKPEDLIDVRDQYNIFEDDDDLLIHFKINNVRNGNYNVKIYSMNRMHGSILDEWERMNLTSSLSNDDIEYFKRICTPRISQSNYEVINETFKMEITLKPHEINMIQIVYSKTIH